MSEMSAICFTAKNEFSRVLRHPMMWVIICVLLMMTLLDGAAIASQLLSTQKYVVLYRLSPEEMLYSGIGNVFYNTLLYLTILSLFIGVSALSEERSNGALRVLITKPLFKRDIMLGKYLGTCGLIFSIIAVDITLLFSMLALMLQDYSIRSMPEILLRMSFLIILIFLSSSLMLGLTMFFGALTKSLFGTLICCVSYLYFEWYMQVPGIISQLWFSPSRLLFSAYAIGDVNLLNPKFPFSMWLNAALPYIMLMILELMLIVILDCIVFGIIEESG
ncbi:ABC transporter permease [Methanocella conradii]|uniref:ABC transporter permease n=1 Tax=Methanocella conradii TaxID=1175444 RepID=UPI0024B32ABB|nr:ABC transporter permease subunit [Methanocella conradii]MDI6898021.1 ABC transporter permease [Methanocella conradii]